MSIAPPDLSSLCVFVSPLVDGTWLGSSVSSPCSALRLDCSQEVNRDAAWKKDRPRAEITQKICLLLSQTCSKQIPVDAPLAADGLNSAGGRSFQHIIILWFCMAWGCSWQQQSLESFSEADKTCSECICLCSIFCTVCGAIQCSIYCHTSSVHSRKQADN